jgi:hypothetical protein
MCQVNAPATSRISPESMLGLFSNFVRHNIAVLAYMKLTLALFFSAADVAAQHGAIK